MKFLLAALLIALPAAAHVMSMSTGDFKIDGARAHYELRIPLYEISHVSRPETALLEHVRFDGARTLSQSCRADQETESYLCTAELEFPSPPDRLQVECTLPSITVPNHVHLLHTYFGARREDTVFDSSLTRTTLRFRDPGAGETAVTHATSGALRILGSPLAWLFFAAMVLAARSQRELAWMTTALVIGQCVAVFALPVTGWQPAPRFADAAAALTVAYLAMELLLLPKSGARWAICAALGALQGLGLHLFIEAARYAAPLVLLGSAVAQVTLAAALWWVSQRIGLPRIARPAASALLVIGLAGFLLALRG